MTRIVATAPGKVVLLGEYAVLEGSPGLVLAIDRRARVTLELCGEDECRVTAPQLGMEPAGFRIGLDGVIEWKHPPRGAFRRTAALIEYLVTDLHQRGGGIGPFRVHIDSAPLFHAGPEGQVKLGLGSSAAVAVALDAAFRQAFGSALPTESREDIISRLLVPVRRAQGGAGSGIDLAASLLGGLSGYRIDEGHGAAQIDLEPLYLPPGLKWLFVWTGSSASTANLLAAWRRARKDNPGKVRAVLDEMAATAEAGLQAVRHDDAAGLAGRIGAYGRIMGKMNDLVNVEVLTGAHRLAMDHADRLGAAYKPCGAGGGDLGVAVSTDSGVIRRLSEALERKGLTILPLDPTRRGVEIASRVNDE